VASNNYACHSSHGNAAVDVMKRATKQILTFLVIALVSAAVGYLICIGTMQRHSLMTGTPVDPDRASALPQSGTGNFTLSVWNQSFEIPNADILVELQPIGPSDSVDQRQMLRLFHKNMPVENQHHVEDAKFQIVPGKYYLYAHELHSGTAGSWQVDVETSQSRGVLLMFWKDKQNAVSRSPFFTLENVDSGFGVM
jgi:hypothetical protein